MWNAEQSKMYEGYSFCDFDIEYFIPGQCDYDDLIIMQFTGITDSNGVDIYEGDIVKSTSNYGINKGKIEQIASVDKISPVLWAWGNFKTIDDALTYVSTTFEVMGNIYQNPELLKEVTC